MRTTRRRFLAVAASGLVTGACVPELGANNGRQTIATNSNALPPDQVLEPHLSMAVPEGAVAPSALASFVRQTGVRPRLEPWSGDGQVMLELGSDLQGRLDLVLLEEETVTAQVPLGAFESLDRSLLPNLRNLEAPFSNPPYDAGSHHSIGFDYTTVGIGLASRVRLSPAASWAGMFALAQELPGVVAVPDDSTVVVGAALVARGHSWNTDSSSDLADAAQLLHSVRGALVVRGALTGMRLDGEMAAIMSSLAASAASTRYVVPVDGTVADLRSFCIPADAPDPVAAHAWLNHVLDPITAAADVSYSRRGTPLRGASYLVSQQLLRDETVFPSAEALANLSFSNVSAAGLASRTEIWEATKA